jgi:hypothetical protein
MDHEPILSRRRLLRRAAAAGAVAWTAPVVLQSMTAPVGAAVSGSATGCFVITAAGDNMACTVVANPCQGLEPSTGPCGTAYQDAAASGKSYASFCIRPPNNCNADGSPKTFTINPGCTCRFVAAYGDGCSPSGLVVTPTSVTFPPNQFDMVMYVAC